MSLKHIPKQGLAVTIGVTRVQCGMGRRAICQVLSVWHVFQHSNAGDTSFQHSEIDATMFQTSEMDVVQFFTPPQLFVPPCFRGHVTLFTPGVLN